MKPKARKIEPEEPDEDVRAWLVIALIFAAVTLAVCAPLVWQAAYHSL